jgi:predicted small lipoprotein YifL
MVERIAPAALPWLLLALLAGCGQKGPLYLPDEARGIVTHPAAPTAPAATQPSPSTPETTDSPHTPANPAPEVTPPESDKDKKEQAARPPR